MLLKGDWIARHENCAIIGPTGIGKSWLACAIGRIRCLAGTPCRRLSARKRSAA
ncbi:ATP-binding protein [Novosphingobium sp. 9U]|uniref:ATP-binding protein n=1 Tax=Novosphingobium sp. 9U TaxID=2653158 RepID=UPI00352E3DC6